MGLLLMIAVAIALFVASAFTCPPPLLPLHHLGWGSKGPYQPVRNPTSATTVGAATIVTVFAACATGREGPVQQCMGLQRPADSLRQCGGAAVGFCVAVVILLTDQQQWQQWQRANSGGGGGVGNVATK